MGKSLVIVESPAKAKTINKYLGDDYKVMASMGHIRDLPTNKIGVDVDHEFEPNYITMPSKKKVITELTAEAKKADRVLLAPDPDREGEAICFHLQEAVIPEGKPTYRVLFNEITKNAVKQAVENPGTTNMNRVDAQQARRILDRLVGYMISPVLWKKVKRGISAGRVQSVALRMIVEREYEILAFNKEEYWSFYAQLEGSKKPDFRTRLMRWEGQSVRQGNKATALAVDNEKFAREIEKALQTNPYSIASIKRKARRQNPPQAFTTSKLQQDASRSLGFSVKKTMMVAQKLYEGIEIKGEPVGLITYMRTDSARVSEEALTQVRDFIADQYDADYLPKDARRVKAKAGAQDGHEAIRPTHVEYLPEHMAKYLDKDELKLYTLIWRRFVASQMTAKKMDETVLVIEAGPAELEAKGLVTTFPGFSILYTEKAASTSSDEEGAKADLPALEEGETLKLLDLETKQNFTKPPARFSEASLVKALEENGIGRPSTYASILSTIMGRDYVEKREGRFHPSELGIVVIDLLLKSFPDLMDIQYTAKMEDRLDEVEHGSRTWQALLGDFYSGFSTELEAAEDKMPNMKRDGLPTDLSCEICSKPMVIKSGRYGQFLSCSDYPECNGAKKIKDLKPSDTEIPVLKAMIGEEQEPSPALEKPCPECGGQLVRKRGRYGEFIACGNYPDCTYIHKETIGVTCPKCTKGEIQQKKSKKGKIFFSCVRYPDCDFISWDKPNGEKCPACNAATLYEKNRKKNPVVYCQNKECDYSRSLEEQPVTA